MPKRNKIEMQGLVERICKMYFNDRASASKALCN